VSKSKPNKKPAEAGGKLSVYAEEDLLVVSFTLTAARISTQKQQNLPSFKEKQALLGFEICRNLF
jgi:hypothetical protein